MGNIKSTAQCQGLPYAAMLIDMTSARSFVLQIHNLALDLGTAGDDWTVQDLHHKRKPGTLRLHYGGYRVLGLSQAEGRLQEELWFTLVGSAPWEAVGEHQDTRKDCVIVALANMLAFDARIPQGLPVGMVWGGRKEAFDTAWRVPTLINMRQRVRLVGRMFAIPDSVLARTRVLVIKGNQRSSFCLPRVGFVEGWKLSPVEFCLGQVPLEQRFERDTVALGLNPPLSAVTAYRLLEDATDDAPYDKEAAEDLYALVQSGDRTWMEVMQAAGDDTTRLIILDLASSVRRAPTSFLDDTQDPVASNVHAIKPVEVLGHAAAEDQCEYRAEKMKITSRGFKHKRPVNLQGGVVSYGDSHVSLGIKSPHDCTGEQHLFQMISQGMCSCGP